MARGIKEKKEEKKTFELFNIMGENKNNFDGRVYLEPTSTAKGCYFRVSLSINDVTVKGVKLWIPADESKDCSFMFPAYKDSDGNYKDFVVLFKENIRKDATEVANKLADIVMSK